jgi:GT2 family glycosyltransferase
VSPDSRGALTVSAIVLAFGKESLLERCLCSLDAALERSACDTEVIVVLNRVSARARDKLESSLPRHVLVPTDRNLGFTGGVAAGLAHARGDWIALFNDDCVLDSDAILELLAAGRRRSDIGSVAAQVRFAEKPQMINSAGIEIDDIGVARERLLGKPAHMSESTVTDVFGASGAAALYRREMLDALGGFDESFFAYLEDAELAWRAQMQGWRAVYAPQAVVLHDHSSTLGHGSRTKHLLVGRNRVRMLAKNATPAQLRRNALRIAAYDLLYVAFLAANQGTLAPLVGRLRGIREWRAYRTAGAADRRAVKLAPAFGFREALKRDRAYRSANRRPN